MSKLLARILAYMLLSAAVLVFGAGWISYEKAKGLVAVRNSGYADGPWVAKFPEKAIIWGGGLLLVGLVALSVSIDRNAPPGKPLGGDDNPLIKR